MYQLENLFGVTVACIILLIFVKLRKSYNYFIDRGLPYVVPTWSDVLKTLSISNFNDIPLEMYDRSRDIDSPYVGFFQTPFKPVILITDPSLAERVLIKDFSYFQDHGFDIDFKTNPLEGNLFNLNGDEWRTVRHKLVPTFTSGKLKGMIPIMEECADKLIQEMNQNPSLKKDTNLKDLFKKYSLSVIASTAFGIDPESIKDPECEFRKIMQDVVSPGSKSILRFSFLFLLPSLAKRLKVKIYSQEAENFFLSLTKQSFEMRKKTGVKRNDFIQLLLELKEKGSVELDVKDLEQDEKDNIAKIQTEPSSKLEFTDELLMAQVFVFLIGGFENTAYLVSIITYMLSKHRDIQTRVREEIKQAVNKHGGIDYQALRDMKLLDACIDETLRLYPPAVVLFRECNKTYTLGDGKKIEKGIGVLVPAKSFQNDNKYWTNPEEFNPDRFLSKENISPGIYMPFGDGPRICIAQRMALIITKLMLAKLISNFDLQPSSKTKEPIKLQVLIGADNEGGFWGSFNDLVK